MKLTDEQLEFLREVMPGRMWFEAAEAFEREFGISLSKVQMRYYRVKLGIDNSALSGHGRPGGRFQKGNVPKQGQKYKVGDERTDQDGYTWVKVSESKYGSARTAAVSATTSDKCWRFKHHLVWEAEHGEPVPKGYSVVFANRDKADFSPANIVAVPKGVLSAMNAMHLQYYDAETLATCMAIAKTKMAMRAKRKEAKEARA